MVVTVLSVFTYHEQPSSPMNVDIYIYVCPTIHRHSSKRETMTNAREYMHFIIFNYSKHISSCLKNTHFSAVHKASFNAQLRYHHIELEKSVPEGSSRTTCRQHAS